ANDPQARGLIHPRFSVRFHGLAGGTTPRRRRRTQEFFHRFCPMERTKMNEAQLQTSTAAFQSTLRTQQGLTFTRRFSTEGVSPYDELQWEHRTAAITDTKGNTIFEQKDVEVPADWSMTATNIVASKYLHGQMNTPERE